MTTDEKRAQLAQQGEAWPDCDCHTAPMYWVSDGRIPKQGYFQCAVTKRGHTNKRRAANQHDGGCVHCGSPLETETLCTACVEKHRETSWRSDHAAHREWKKYLANLRRANKKRFEESPPTGAGHALIADHYLPGR